MTVRVARGRDADALAAIEAESGSAAWPAVAVAAALADPTTLAFVWDDHGVPGGHVITRTAADEAEILTLAVLPAHRRRGVASALLHAADAAWMAAGVRMGFLEVRAGNGAALALYTGRGWAPVGLRRCYYADGEDAVVMRRELTTDGR